MIIRPEKEEDYAAIFEVNKLAFGGEEEAELVDALRKLDDFIPKLSIVALEDEQVIGHILLTPIIIETKGGSIPALALAPIAVHPEFQNQGIGSELIKKGLEKCKELRHEIVVVLGHPLYYPRFGFGNAKEKGIKAPFEVADEAFMVIELVNNALEGVKGTVKYPKPFNRFI
jgi:putative acetyltransferase